MVSIPPFLPLSHSDSWGEPNRTGSEVRFEPAQSAILANRKKFTAAEPNRTGEAFGKRSGGSRETFGTLNTNRTGRQKTEPKNRPLTLSLSQEKFPLLFLPHGSLKQGATPAPHNFWPWHENVCVFVVVFIRASR